MILVADSIEGIPPADNAKYRQVLVDQFAVAEATVHCQPPVLTEQSNSPTG